MQREAVYHRPSGNYAYIYDAQTLHLRIRTKRNDVVSVRLHWGDKYDWKQTKQVSEMEKLATDKWFDYWQVAICPSRRRVRYCFELLPTKSSRVLYMTERDFVRTLPKTPDQFFDFPYLHLSHASNIPDWAQDATFYQVFPERFANGDPTLDQPEVAEWDGTPRIDNFFGGDLQGILDHVDHLAGLGIHALYMTPIFESPSNHKYDTVDYKKIDPHFGTLDTLKQLVKACHDLGMRVVLDAVFNHCGFDYPPFQDVLQHGEKSRYKDWFHIHSFPIVTEPEPNYECFGFYPKMPKFNTQNLEVKELLLDVARYWMEEADVDGWRLDVANEVDHEFWRDFRKVVKGVKADALIIGEIWHDSMPWLHGDQFDTVMNYLFTDAVLEFTATGTIQSAAAFDERLGSIIAMYPAPVTNVMFNHLDSHDTPRLLTLCKHDKAKMKLAAFLQLTSPGMPCIYYGDEVGMYGAHDPDCRKPMVWDEAEQDLELLSFYKEVIGLRNKLAPLRRGDRKTLYAAPKQQGYLFSRTYANETVYVALNNGPTPVSIPFSVTTPDAVLTNQLRPDHQVQVDGDGNALIELAGFGYAIYHFTFYVIQ